MKIISFFLTTYLLLFVTALQAQEKRSINLACGPFPPFKIENSDKPGIDIDVIKASFLAVGRETKYSFFPWKRAVALTSNGSVDGLCGCSFTPERETSFRFSDIMGHHSQGIFTKSNRVGPRIKSLKDLKKLSVATVRGYVIQSELKALGIENVGVLDHRQLVSMLLNDRVDAVYAYRDVFLYNLMRESDSDLIDYIELKSQPYYACISRAIPDSVSITNDLNQGLRIVRHNGQYQKIWQSYLGFD